MDEEQLLTVESSKHDAPHAYGVSVRGDLDLSGAAVLSQKFDELIDAGATLIVLDAAGVAFMDSTGLRAIVAARNRLEHTGGHLFIEGMSGAAQRVLEITGLLDTYQRHPTD